MKPYLAHRRLTLVLLASLLMFAPLRGGRTADEKPSEKLSGWQRLFRQQAAGYNVVVDGDDQREAKLVSEPVLQWSQPVRGGDDGAVFLWVQAGRPVAIGTFFIWPAAEGIQGITHELHSLSTMPLTAVWRDRKWTPPRDSAARQAVSGAPPPAETPEQRLRQMRELARQFQAESRDKNDRTWQLRLLPRRLYRYEIDAGAAGADGVTDGALFGFVEGTDLEVVLLLEARTTADGPQWECAFARMSDFRLKVTREGQTLWEVEPAVFDNPRSAYFCSTVERRKSADEEE